MRYRRAQQKHVYNVAVPSLETIISREVLWKSTVTLKISQDRRPQGTVPVNYGVTDALAPFPLKSLVNVMSATINNNTVSFNVQETLPLLLRMLDPEELSKYNCMTPTALDYLANYTDVIQRMDFHIDLPHDGGGPYTEPTVYYPGDTESEANRQTIWHSPNILSFLGKQHPSVRHEPSGWHNILAQITRVLADQANICN